MVPRISIGGQTAFSARSVLEPFEFAVAAGFRAFEWFPDKKENGQGWLPKDLDEALRRYIRHTARGMGISLSVHARWEADPFTPGFFDIIREDILFARDIGAELVNIHYRADFGTKGFLESIVPVLELTSHEGMTLTVENTPTTSPFDMNELFGVLGEFGDVPIGHFGMCLDIGHANLHEATRNNYLMFMDLLAPHVPVRHVHLHENFGDADSHLTVFTGPSAHDTSGIEGALSRLIGRGFEGAIILEQWPERRELLTSASDRLYHIIARHEHERPPKEVVPAAPEETDVCRMLIEQNAEAMSWRKKLNLVLSIISKKRFLPSVGNMACLAVYLRFLGTGKVVCVEDGRHFRPVRHAETSAQIEQRLHELTTHDNAFVMRKIYPWLPSHDERFTRAEPLTRIRDIAHRNDIPRELKSEIKQTLQNKLHRCAGPEDLVTSEAILKRITAPDAEYPEAFINEFRKFHAELKEFFNASTLEERLTDLAETVLSKAEAEVEKFIELKNRKSVPGAEVLETLSILTGLREQLNTALSSAEGALRQKLRMADIDLESYAFVLLSRISNDIEEKEPADIPWKEPMMALKFALANLFLTGTSTAEARASLNETVSIASSFKSSDHLHLLRLKAALDRIIRMTGEYTDRMLRIFPPLVMRLGKALHVDEQSIRFFTEGDLRGDVVFQLSRLVEAILSATRALAGLPLWDTLSPGKAAGRLVIAETLGNIPESISGPAIVLASKASGEEDIPSVIKGIVLGQHMPHLSHLGVRARQHKVVFASCENRKEFETLRALDGQKVVLDAREDGARLVPGEAVYEGEPSVAPHLKIELPEVDLTPGPAMIGVEEISQQTCGAKAWGIRRLFELCQQSEKQEAEFRVPRTFAVPFHVYTKAVARSRDMELALAALGQSPASPDTHALQSLRALIVGAAIPEEVLSTVINTFVRTQCLMVRSSSNLEDLPGLAGAGVYESIANVFPDNVEEAVRTVWASLWSGRAVRSRASAGIPHDRAQMAVLIQEMLSPDYSFFMHTAHPITLDPGKVYIEIAAGLGETLASGTVAGTPYRLAVDKHSGSVETLSYSSISSALYPAHGGGMNTRTVDYSDLPLTSETAALAALGKRLSTVGLLVESGFGGAQDIEGAIVNNDIFLLQSRPQQGGVR